MTNNYSISGMTCNNCRASVENKLTAIAGVTAVKVNLEQGEATISMNQPLGIETLQDALPEKYKISQKSSSANALDRAISEVQQDSKWLQLRPLFLVLTYIAIASLLLHYKDWNAHSMMLDFMGLFFLVFSFFKVLDLKGFSASFRMYDPLARAIPGYANIYPFVETVLAIMLLMRFQIAMALVATIVVLGITSIGVTKAVMSKSTIRCACLGTALNLPMTEATLIENALMLAMAITSLLFLV